MGTRGTTRSPAAWGSCAATRPSSSSCGNPTSSAIIARAQLPVQNLHTEMYVAGDAVQDQVANFTRIAGEMGFM